jgi:hypothetical protein
MSQGNPVGQRVHEIRSELYGELGVEALARSLGIPSRTWLNYERGVTIPGAVMLGFLDVTGASPHWLLTGEGERFISGAFDKIIL